MSPRATASRTSRARSPPRPRSPSSTPSPRPPSTRSRSPPSSRSGGCPSSVMRPRCSPQSRRATASSTPPWSPTNGASTMPSPCGPPPPPVAGRSRTNSPSSPPRARPSPSGTPTPPSSRRSSGSDPSSRPAPPALLCGPTSPRVACPFEGPIDRRSAASPICSRTRGRRDRPGRHDRRATPTPSAPPRRRAPAIDPATTSTARAGPHPPPPRHLRAAAACAGRAMSMGSVPSTPPPADWGVPTLDPGPVRSRQYQHRSFWARSPLACGAVDPVRAAEAAALAGGSPPAARG